MIRGLEPKDGHSVAYKLVSKLKPQLLGRLVLSLFLKFQVHEACIYIFFFLPLSPFLTTKRTLIWQMYQSGSQMKTDGMLKLE